MKIPKPYVIREIERHREGQDSDGVGVPATVDIEAPDNEDEQPQPEVDPGGKSEAVIETPDGDWEEDTRDITTKIICAVGNCV